MQKIAVVDDADGDDDVASRTSSGLPATITRAPAKSQCPPCQINISAGGGGMSRVYWWNSTLGLTLDTVSVVVTQYNHTAVTKTTTVHGDVSSLDATNITETQDLQYFFENRQYPGQPGILLVNGTEGPVDRSLSYPYPTSYLVVPGYRYYTQTASGLNYNGCPAGQYLNGNTCDCLLATPIVDPNFANRFISANDTLLTQTYYSTLAPEHGRDLREQLAENILDVFNVAPFSAWLASINPRPPGLESCYIVGFVGPPALKVPVSALTGTSTTTVTGTDNYSWTRATPAFTVSAKVPVKTSMAATREVNEPSATSQSSLQNSDDLEIARNSDSVEGPQVGTLARPPAELVAARLTSTFGPSSVHLAASEESVQDRTSSESENLVTTSGKTSPKQDLTTSPIFSFLGSTYTLGMSSTATIAGQAVTPGGAVIVSGSTFTFPAIIGTSIKPPPRLAVITRPVISFLGSTYTMGISSNIILEEQTLQQGSAITVSGSVVSMPSGGSLLVAGSTTETLSRVMITTTAVTSDTSIATSGPAAGFVMDGTTLVPTSVSTGHKISASGSNEGIVGKAAPGSLGGEAANRTSTASGTSDTSAKPADIGEAESTANPGGFQPTPLAVLGTCVSVMLIACVL
ncbi:MAG: hypothetical protein Q9182_001321 [Xanthomendoza sp. 2 TL-2023]